MLNDYHSLDLARTARGVYSDVLKDVAGKYRAMSHDLGRAAREVQAIPVGNPSAWGLELLWANA